MDPLYPLTIAVDQCLGAVNEDNYIYYYTMASPCQWNPAMRFREKILPCSKDPICKKGIKEYALANWEVTSLEVLGIAFDGHAIYGPYDAAGNLW